MAQFSGDIFERKVLNGLPSVARNHESTILRSSPLSVVPSEGWWSRQESNLRPSHCERDALPTELRPQPNCRENHPATAKLQVMFYNLMFYNRRRCRGRSKSVAGGGPIVQRPVSTPASAHPTSRRLTLPVHHRINPCGRTVPPALGFHPGARTVMDPLDVGVVRLLGSIGECETISWDHWRAGGAGVSPLLDS